MAAPRTRASRLPLAVAAVALVAIVLLGTAAYARVSGDNAPSLSPGAPYTEGITGTWQRVNPLFAAENAADRDLAQLVFSGLVRTGEGGEILPDLAASLPEISPDGRSYAFALRQDVQWHDGEQFTAHDVAFTVERIQDPGFRGPSTVSALWEGIEVSAPDDHTVTFRLPEPSSPFLARNATQGILPRHLLEEHSADRLYESSFNVEPVGTGPYRLAALNTAEARLEAYGDYHHDRPAIGDLRLRFFPDNNEALSALESGEIQGLLLRDPPSDEQEEVIEDLGAVTLMRPQRAAHVLLYLNNDAAAYFQDERVRRAIALAIDREAIVDQVYDDAATASSSPVAPGSWAYDAALELAEDDPLEAARALLDDAGWEPHPTTGIRVRLGSEFRFTIRTDNNTERLAVAQLIAQQLEPLGIRANVASTSFAVLRRDFLQERRYEAAVAGWDQGLDPDPYFAWHSSQMGTAGLNIANYSDPIADRLIEEARQRSSAEVRLDMYHQFQEIWHRFAPSVVVAYPRYTYIQSDGIDSDIPEFLPAAHLRFTNIHDWRRT